MDRDKPNTKQMGKDKAAPSGTSQEAVDEALEESFPASDPPAYATPHKPETWKGPEGGRPDKGAPAKAHGDTLKDKTRDDKPGK